MSNDKLAAPPVPEGAPPVKEQADNFTEPASIKGWHNGTLYCYGGCGTRYVDFPSDVSLPTPLWNRIAVGEPFDETQPNVEREGRGGVLCPSCIMARLAALPDRTVICANIETQPDLPASEGTRRDLAQLEERLMVLSADIWGVDLLIRRKPDLSPDERAQVQRLQNWRRSVNEIQDAITLVRRQLPDALARLPPQEGE